MSASDSVTPGLYAEALARQIPILRSERAQLFRRALVRCEKVADFASAALGVTVAFSMSTERHASPRAIIAVAMIAGIFAVFELRSNQGYEGGGGLLQIRETERVIRTAVSSLLYLIPMHFMLASAITSSAIAIAPICIAVSLIVQKRCLFSAVRSLDRRRLGADRVLIYGASSGDRRVASLLLRSFRLGLEPAAIIDDRPEATDRYVMELGYRNRHSIPIIAAPLTRELLAARACTTLVVVTNELNPGQIAAASDCAQFAGAKVAFVSDLDTRREFGTICRIVDDLSVTMDRGPSTSYEWYGLSKRVLDVALSSIALVLLSPILLFIAMLIKLDSPGSVLFIQNRVGLNGRVFRIYKFRSMYAESAEYEPSPTTSMDPRLTRIGRFLRRLSLDELPQLVNVIQGDMSLVGPRPEMPFIVQGYDPVQMKRLSVVPGITGLWQLSADRAFAIHENPDYDLYYVRNRGFFMDISILIHTALFAMRGGI